MSTESKRVLEEIEYRFFRRTADKALFVIFVILYALVFGSYLVNRAKPMILGVSPVFLYSLIVWGLIILFTIIAAKSVWR